MSDKLLRAFIEASGFEIKETPAPVKYYGEFTCASVTIDYKVTKKDAESNAHQVILDTQGAEWACIVAFVLGHKDDIESSVNDYGDLQPMLDYFNRNSPN